MKLYITGHDFNYELENIARMYFREVSTEAAVPPRDAAGDRAWCWRTANCESVELGCAVYVGAEEDGGRLAVSPKATDKECEMALAKLLWLALSRLTGKKPAWGVVTGIRPANFASALLDTRSPAAVRALLEKDYFVAPAKAALCVETAIAGDRIARTSGEKSYSLYVAIPFCPTRCSYCSFVSKSVERDRSLMEPYLGLLCEELARTAAIAQDLSLRLESVYIGGGTPTVLSAPQLQKLTDAVQKYFPLERAREFCVEAGRPDTIDADKLAVLSAAGVTRLSINPQTRNPAVLAAIGRKHSPADVERAFELAREAGFDNINADLIAGLPLDTYDSFRDSLEWLLSLEPENITVHALTLKRASRMTENGDSASPDAARMVDLAYRRLHEAGYGPYYMYKQKGTVDSLENTGYAKPGFEGLYNAYIMDELHTILACGAGAVTKLKNQKSGLIRRIFNYKYPKEYIEGFGEILRRKESVYDFYQSGL